MAALPAMAFIETIDRCIREAILELTGAVAIPDVEDMARKGRLFLYTFTNVPFLKSAKACWISSTVFITNGP